MAWYSAVPEGQKESRLESYKSLKRVRDSSQDNLAEEVHTETQDIPLPDIPYGAEYLESFLFSAGTATQTGMGLVPLSWTEIKAWVDCNELTDTISPWELILIRKLSEEYCAEYHRASDVKRPQPYLQVVENIEEVRDKVADQLASIFSGYKKIKG